jgi:hypothetical protein
MEPQNKQERKSAFTKFFGVYALSMIFPVGGMYMLSAVPDAVSGADSAKYRKIVEEQTPTVVDVDTVGSFAKELIKQDGVFLTAIDPATKGAAKVKIDELESKISTVMNAVKGRNNEQEQNKSLSHGVTGMIESIVAYRTTLTDMRGIMDKNGVDLTQVNELRGQIQQKDMEISMMKGNMDVLKIQAMKGASGSGGGPDPQVQTLKNRIAQLESGSKSGGGTTLVQGIPMSEMLEYAKAEGFSQLAFKQTKKYNEREAYFDQALDIFSRLEERSMSQEMKNKARAKRIDLEANQSRIPN